MRRAKKQTVDTIFSLVEENRHLSVRAKASYNYHANWGLAYACLRRKLESKILCDIEDKANSAGKCEGMWEFSYYYFTQNKYESENILYLKCPHLEASMSICEFIFHITPHAPIITLMRITLQNTIKSYNEKQEAVVQKHEGNFNYNTRRKNVLISIDRGL